MSSTHPVVKKSNDLVTASYTLTLSEQRLILLAIVERERVDGSRIEVRAEEYADRFNLTRQTSYVALRDAAENLFERRFSYTTQDKRGNEVQVKSRWVQKIEYIEASGTVAVLFADDVLPLLRDLKNRFTYYGLEQVANLTSTYALRLYEYLMSWRSTQKTPVLLLEELRRMLGVVDGDYPRLTDFKRRVLDVAVAQVNEHTDVNVDYSQQKSGRQVVSVSFSFSQKKTSKPVATRRRKVLSESELAAFARPGETREQALARYHAHATK